MLNIDSQDLNPIDHGTFIDTKLNFNITMLFHVKYNCISILESETTIFEILQSLNCKACKGWMYTAQNITICTHLYLHITTTINYAIYNGISVNGSSENHFLQFSLKQPTLNTRLNLHFTSIIHTKLHCWF